MWVVFWMTYAEVDQFVICEDEEDAKTQYEAVRIMDETSCAGYAPIKQSTDWTPTI